METEFATAPEIKRNETILYKEKKKMPRNPRRAVFADAQSNQPAQPEEEEAANDRHGVELPEDRGAGMPTSNIDFAGYNLRSRDGSARALAVAVVIQLASLGKHALNASR